MDYEYTPTIYRLKFTDPRFNGLEVRAYAPPMGLLLDGMQLADVTPETIKTENLKQMAELFQVLGDALVSWNIKKGGLPIPATLGGLRSLDQPFALQIITAWVSAASGVAAPLGRPSSVGGLSPGVSIPMEPLSPNRES